MTSRRRIIRSPRLQTRAASADVEAERLCGLEVDDEFDFGSLPDWQIGWPLAFENAPGIVTNLAGRIVEAATIARQAAGQGELTE
jgi:hypothetical protein